MGVPRFLCGDYDEIYKRIIIILLIINIIVLLLIIIKGEYLDIMYPIISSSNDECNTEN